MAHQCLDKTLLYPGIDKLLTAEVSAAVEDNRAVRDSGLLAQDLPQSNRGVVAESRVCWRWLGLRK
jgi:hypothetical protein